MTGGRTGRGAAADPFDAVVTFLRPAFAGDRLTASAREVSRIGRGGIYDIKVTNQNGEHVAEFRGHSRTVKGTPIPAPG